MLDEIQISSFRQEYIIAGAIYKIFTTHLANPYTWFYVAHRIYVWLIYFRKVKVELVSESTQVLAGNRTFYRNTDRVREATEHGKTL